MSTPDRNPFRKGLRAAKANVGPGLVLQAVAVGIVVAYYTNDSFAAALGQVGEAKARFGFAFSMVSTVVFAAIIPQLVQQCRPTWRHLAPIRHLPFFILFWAVKGAEVDLLYRVQALMFGSDASVLTVTAKVVFDQFIYCPFFAAPVMVLAYMFKESDYSPARTRRNLGAGWLRTRVLPLMIANWGVWLPAVICIYCLPTDLQLPIQNLVLCMWSLMLLFITEHNEAAAEVEPVT